MNAPRLHRWFRRLGKGAARYWVTPYGCEISAGRVVSTAVLRPCNGPVPKPIDPPAKRVKAQSR